MSEISDKSSRPEFPATPRSLWLAVAVVVLLAPMSARAFAIFRGFGVTPEATMQFAARWTTTTGLDDGLQVGIHSNLGAALALPGEDPALIEAAVLAGIAPWAAASPAIDFGIEFDAFRRVHHEIWFQALPGTDPVFATNDFFGFADVRTRSATRTLTNGQTFQGFEIYQAFIYFNIDNMLVLGALGEELRRDVLTRITLHELGHGLGLGHPNDNGPFPSGSNYDTDTDPLNEIVVDPDDPFSQIIVSPNPDNQTIMSNAPCGTPAVLCDAASFASLQPDDLGGLRVLYPIPEPGLGLLVSLAAGAALTARGGRSGFRSLRSGLRSLTLRAERRTVQAGQTTD